jgi:uncharacterized protein YgbK (DUF1537 family)
MLLGAVADDFTGASDLANTLATGGMRTVQYVGVPGNPADPKVEAGVVALKSRTIRPADAVAQSLAALDWLKAQGCRQFLFKYCSTFDSTKEGNIGPVAEAMLKALDAPRAVVCPVFPATGRTLFMGHLFVGDRMLSETGMSDHPLTPMTDPDIRRWLGYQTREKVGLVPYAMIRRGSEAIATALAAEAAAGRRLIVTDAVTDDDLRAIGVAIAHDRLITGGSGIAIGLPENFRREGLIGSEAATLPAISGPGVVLSGSCSEQSRKQAAAHLVRHPGLSVTPKALIDGTLTVADALAWVRKHRDAAPIVYSTAAPDEVRSAQERYGREASAAAVEDFFGRLAVGLAADGTRRIVVGGGETSGSVVTALGLGELRIGREIDKGVPALAAAHRSGTIGLALKSGNFGGESFYDKALAVLGGA